MSLFHGVDLRFSTIGAVKVAGIPTNVIALIGTAPSGPVNQLIMTAGSKQIAAFGAQVPGFTIPYALDLINQNAPGTQVIVINVFDPAVATTAVVAEAVTLAGGIGKTAFNYVGTPVVKNSGGTVTYVAGTDYVIDPYGSIRSLNFTTIAANAVLAVTYQKPNFSAITNTEIIGTVNGTTGVRTGLKLLENAYNKLAVEPRILLAPGFSSTLAITNELAVWDQRLGSISLIDAPSGTSIPAVKAGRTTAGTINFNVSNKSQMLLYPEGVAYDPSTGGTVNRPLSAFAAGVIARTDRAKSYSKSPSNEQIYGMLGLAVEMSGSSFNDGTDVNDLNSLGITTVLNEGTTGFLLWGNTSAAYPSITTPDYFIAVYRTGWIIGRSLQHTALKYVDERITLVQIDQIRQTGNSYINKLIGSGDLLDGSECVFDEAASDIQAGKLQYLVRIAPPTPGQLITFNIGLDLNIYNNLAA